MNCQHRSTNAVADYSLKAIVDAYLDRYAAGEERYLRFYVLQRSLPDAISKAAMAELPSGKRFAHQRRIPRSVLAQAKARLLKLSYRNVRTFSQLYEMVRNSIGPIRGIGPLTVYDTAHRLGAYLKLSPEYVFLHAGTKKGAAILCLGRGKIHLPLTAFPSEFRRLRPEQVEDCLCIYKRELAKWATVQRR
ncbi:MAG TPA: hypothetical protein VMF08_02775 [Candidatus Sulfotelmatobacter sp.]|nr:hypothetical protein [Candidatus Sulfotelmatobacter sp.]